MTVTTVRTVLLIAVTLVAIGMAGRLVYAFRHLSLGQKLFFLGSFCFVLYAGDAMKDAVQAGLAWKWRLIPGFVGTACLLAWLLEPLELQKRLWGRRSFEPPPDLLRDAVTDTGEQMNWIGQVADYAIFAMAMDGTILTWNRGAEKLKGYTAQEAIGKNFSMFYTLEDQATGTPQRLLAMAESLGRVERTGWRVRKDGTRFFGDVVITLVRDPQGGQVGFVKVVRDLTKMPKATAPAEAE